MAKTVHRSLLIVGGAKDKVGRAIVLRRLVRLAGARSARIAGHPRRLVLPRPGGADLQHRLRPARRTRGRRSEPALTSQRRHGAGFGHGQCHRRLPDGGQPAQAQPALRRHAPGRGHLPSTRAGLRRGWCVGRSLDLEPVHDLAGLPTGRPRQHASQLTSGLGLLPGVIIDQHFDERQAPGSARGPDRQRHGNDTTASAREPPVGTRTPRLVVPDPAAIRCTTCATSGLTAR
jgi:cyanophycinase